MNASRLSCALLLAALGCSNANRPPANSEVGKSTTSNEPDSTKPKPKEVRVTGFSAPESVLWDSRADVYLVSNVSGAPTAQDDDGFISRVDPDGTIASLRWIDGKQEGVELSAPKGMCVVGDMLLVADLDQVRRFDRNDGSVKGSIGIPDAQALNDITCTSAGKAWVSDTATNKIHEIADIKVDTSRAVLEAPGINGLTVDRQDRLWAVADGKVFRIDEAGNRTDEHALPTNATGLDGIVALDDGTLLISSWGAKAVMYGRPGEVFMPLFEDLDSPADIGYDADRKRLLIPLMKEDAVVLRDLP